MFHTKTLMGAHDSWISISVPNLLLLWWFYNTVAEIGCHDFLPEEPVCKLSIDLFGLCNMCVIFVLSGGSVYSVRWERPQPLGKASNLYTKFLESTQLIYEGINDISLSNVGVVLHPVDNFVKHFYDRYHPKECVEAFTKYKRSNPTLSSKLDYLEKFASPFRRHVPVAELDEALEDLWEDVILQPEFTSLMEEIKGSVVGRLFDNVKLDGSSASGFPYKQGRKKRDDERHARHVAMNCMDDDICFDEYINAHVWYSTGRAKMLAVEAPDSARLIVYSGYAYLLMAMLFLQPWSRFMNHFDWCGVGFSWMNNGAGRFAEYFEAEKGVAPKGFRYVTLDISSWDTRLHRDLMMMLAKFYSKLLIRAGVPNNDRKKCIRLVKGMIDAVILMPLGHAFRVMQGMKSGWGATANDNTLLHRLVFLCISKRLGIDIKHVLYGDDNFMLVPDHISDIQIMNEYERFGLKAKFLHSSRLLAEVDFLSKHIVYRDGYYYVFRESVESHSRILMPEESDPRRRERPDVVVSAERVLGHLLDNPFNSNVRKVCYNLLERFNKDYGLEYVEVHDRMIKEHPWRHFDVDTIPRQFPTVPSMLFIEELYGVPFPDRLEVAWPSFKAVIRSFGEDRQSNDSIPYDTACSFATDVAQQMYTLAGKKYNSLVRRMSPFSQPKRCYGFHAARMEFAIKYFDIKFNNVLDLGSHPGACAASLAKYTSDIVCVSQLPPKDTRGFCPYIARAPNIKLIKMNANNFIPSRPFDLQHDDVDIVGDRSLKDEAGIALGMLDRAQKNHKMVVQCLITIKEIDWRVRDKLYRTYLDYGYFDMVKPLFSNPWKSEFVVYFRRERSARMRRSVFNSKLNGLLNATAGDMFQWNEAIANAVSGFKGVGDVPPFREPSSSYEEAWVKAW